MHASKRRPNSLGLASLGHVYADVIVALGRRGVFSLYTKNLFTVTEGLNKNYYLSIITKQSTASNISQATSFHG